MCMRSRGYPESKASYYDPYFQFSLELARHIATDPSFCRNFCGVCADLLRGVCERNNRLLQLATYV